MNVFGERAHAWNVWNKREREKVAALMTSSFGKAPHFIPPPPTKHSLKSLSPDLFHPHRTTKKERVFSLYAKDGRRDRFNSFYFQHGK